MTEPKYNIGDKFILEIADIDQETITEGYPKPAYMIKGIPGIFSENVLNNLERIEPVMAAAPKTNADKLRTMTDEELAAVIICPYDTAGEPQNIMPCMVNDNVNPASDNDCTKCCKKWLEREYEALQNQGL